MLERCERFPTCWKHCAYSPQLVSDLKQLVALDGAEHAQEEVEGMNCRVQPIASAHNMSPASAPLPRDSDATDMSEFTIALQEKQESTKSFVRAIVNNAPQAQSPSLQALRDELHRSRAEARANGSRQACL